MTPDPNSSEATTVLIVGAGPTGLTLACDLARRGVPFRLIEACPGPQAGSRGKGIQPRSLEVFDNLGIVERVLTNGQMAMPMRITAADGKVVTRNAQPGTAQPGTPYLSTLITPEWRIEEAMRELLGELGGSVEFGTSLTGLEQTDESVLAHIAIAGRPETVKTRWLVGCDGGHSAVRKQAGIAFEGETREEVRMIVADVQVDGLARDAWNVWQHPEGFMALCPLPSTDVFQYQAAIAPGQNPELTLSNLQDILRRRTGRDGLRVQQPEWISLWRANIRLADRYRAGAVLLAGDAAHIHSPGGGQGMNTGIQDAQNLGWKLAAVTRGAPAALLDTYETERRPVAASVLALSNARLEQAIKERSIPTNRDQSTMQLDLQYRDSPLSHDDRDPSASLRAGDRAPDAARLATIDGERRFFDLTRGGAFVLLNFGPPVEASTLHTDLVVFQVTETPVHANQVADRGGQLASLYGATGSTLLLIRPDGYVAFISDAGDASSLASYLSEQGL